MYTNYMGTPDIEAFSAVVNRVRSFFLEKGFVEVHTQDRLSILAACEDPDTVATYMYNNELWPLPQTGQMWLEYELLTKPTIPGVFCVSTSYRQEPNPVPGRHKTIFPMFEFESRGGMEELRLLEQELLEYLGFGKRESFAHIAYKEAGAVCGQEDITGECEAMLHAKLGDVVFLEMFPEYTSPFWNMKRNADGAAQKIDVIMHGMETIGSAERSTDREEMRERFLTISDGGYAKKLYDLFGEKRVKGELDAFLALDFFPRYGAGIGMTRLMRAMKESKLV